METLETLLARKYNVYLSSGSPTIPALQIGSFLTAGDAINAVLDWEPRIAGSAAIAVYVNDTGNTSGGELAAVYGQRSSGPMDRAPLLGWEY